jgi:uncharacterized protein (DUF697 family)
MAHKPHSSTGHDKDAATAAVTPEERHATAIKLVDNFAIWSGVAGLIPIPLVDLATVTGIQIQMVRRLSQMYDVPFTENRTKAIVAGLGGSLIPAPSGLGAGSLLKGIPILGTLVAGFAMPVLASGATFAIGMAFIQHFETGGTLLDFNPPDYREFLRSQKEMWITRNRNKTSETSAATGS